MTTTGPDSAGMDSPIPQLNFTEIEQRVAARTPQDTTARQARLDAWFLGSDAMTIGEQHLAAGDLQRAREFFSIAARYSAPDALGMLDTVTNLLDLTTEPDTVRVAAGTALAQAPVDTQAERDLAVQQAQDRARQSPSPQVPMGSRSGLSADWRRRLIEAGVQRRWSAGQVLISESEGADHVVLLTGGRVKVSVTAPSGRQVLLAIRGPGDLLGEIAAIDGDVQSATVTALTAVDGVSLTNAEFHRFMLATPSVTVELLKMVVKRLRESTQRRLENGAYDVPARTARLLIDYARDYGEPVRGGLTVNLRQSELAEAAGASREAVAKALKVFRDAGAVRTNRCSFDVLRMDLLDRFAEGIA